MTAQQAFENFDDFFHSVIDHTACTFELSVTSYECNGPPGLKISFNNETLFEQHLSAGQHVLQFDLDIKTKNQLTFGMFGKNLYDTKVVDNVIVADKSIVIDSLSLNNYNLLDDIEFYQTYFQHRSNLIIESAKHGFWTNADLIFEFESPFVEWYNQRTNKNTVLSSSLLHQSNTQTDQAFDQLVESLSKLVR
jgi:hypothetical protein